VGSSFYYYYYFFKHFTKLKIHLYTGNVVHYNVECTDENTTTTPHTTTVLWPFFQDNPGELVPEENFWTLWCKGRLIEADTLTIWLHATPSGLTSAHLHH